MQIEEFITESVFFKHLSDTTTQVVSGESKQNYGETNGYLNLPSVPTSKSKRQFRLKDLDCFMLISSINSFEEILSSKRYKSITNFKSSHDKKSADFNRDNLEGSFNANKKSARTYPRIGLFHLFFKLFIRRLHLPFVFYWVIFV